MKLVCPLQSEKSRIIVQRKGFGQDARRVWKTPTNTGLWRVQLRTDRDGLGDDVAVAVHTVVEGGL